MCFTEFCFKYSIPDPEDNKALCWKCSSKSFPVACEEEELGKILSADVQGSIAGSQGMSEKPPPSNVGTIVEHMCGSPGRQHR